MKLRVYDVDSLVLIVQLVFRCVRFGLAGIESTVGIWLCTICTGLRTEAIGSEGIVYKLD